MKTTCIFLILLVQHLTAQSIEFNVSVSNDTLLLGNYLEVKFEIINGNGKFKAPDFAGWNIVAGPNTASSYSIINGNVKQSSSYTYYLEAPTEGNFYIGEALLSATDKEYKTPPVWIVVQDNPEGIRQHPKFNQIQKSISLTLWKKKSLRQNAKSPDCNAY
jgi:hypothetical protein